MKFIHGRSFLYWKPTHKLEVKYSPYTTIYVTTTRVWRTIHVDVKRYNDKGLVEHKERDVKGWNAAKVGRKILANETAAVDHLMVMMQCLDRDAEIYWRTMGAS